MSASALRIQGGRVIDPCSSEARQGVVRDVCIVDGRIVASIPDGVPFRTLDATGMVVMAGGVDIHSHIASPLVTAARAMQQTGIGPSCIPSTRETGRRYAAMGYTTVVEAAVSPAGVRESHLQLEDTPCIDSAMLLMLDNHEAVLRLLQAGRRADALALATQLLARSGALGIKLVNPGGVFAFRHDPRLAIITDIDQPLPGGSISPRAILTFMADLAELLGLKHAPHVHCNALGIPGNVRTTLQTLDALQGRRVHLAHLQFHAYGQSKSGDHAFAADQLSTYLAEHPLVTADVGQVMFGSTWTLTADTPLQHMLWKITGSKHTALDIEQEAGCAVMPFEYRERSFVHSLQWATGLCLMLQASDPWRMFLSTDHPSGASFVTYPKIIAMLMSEAYRREQMKRANQEAVRSTPLAGLGRELDLWEIAVMTRAGPARALGLERKGSLAPGADADVTLYDDKVSDPEAMFSSPRYVIKAGQIVAQDGQQQQDVPGMRWAAKVMPSAPGAALLEQWHQSTGRHAASPYGLHDSELARLERV